ncbi:MAG TPA: hypothetical protein VMJ70_07020 [Candidatus Sulfotelmatobacter sp.]|nr:hypothetical protein [Candidatus Sulfotelmatobacter sp.]
MALKTTLPPAALRKHPALRVAAWQWVAPEFQRQIRDAIIGPALQTLPFQPVRVELVGSMVRGCGHLGSDLDLNLAARNWSEQVEWRRIWAEPQHRQRFLDAIAEVVVPLGLLVDVAPNNPDQYEYDLCLDLITGACPQTARLFPDRSSRVWDGYQLRWVPVPLSQKRSDFVHDAWAEDAPLWRSRYGERFLKM